MTQYESLNLNESLHGLSQSKWTNSMERAGSKALARTVRFLVRLVVLDSFMFLQNAGINTINWWRFDMGKFK